MLNYTEGLYKERKYFSTTRTYTLALLNAFNNVNYWVEKETDEEQKEFVIPISFGNYEKAVALQDLDSDTIKKGNFNFLPRLVLSFEGMSKAPERQTNKFQKLSKRICHPDTNNPSLDVSYNSVSYDYHFTLLLQARGLTIATQVTEEILSKFNPSLNLEIKEFPIFTEPTETQILIGDPAFEIITDFETIDVNIMQVTFDINIRGNIYSPIELSGPIEVVKLFTHIWDEEDYKDSKLADYYRFDVNLNTNKPEKETARIFDATKKTAEIVETPNEQELIDKRDDYSPHQYVTDLETTDTPGNKCIKEKE